MTYFRNKVVRIQPHAKALGKEVNDIRSEFGLEKLYITKKKCLKCNMEFKAVGKNNWLCSNCRDGNNRHYDWEYGD